MELPFKGQNCNQPNLNHQVLLEAQAEWTEVPRKGVGGSFELKRFKFATKAEKISLITECVCIYIQFNEIFI